MKISYNWLCSYLPKDLKLTPQEIAVLLTDSGLEVEAVEKIETVKGGLEGLVIGKVLSRSKHPDADKLSLTTVDIGAGEPLNIVCGAANVAEGQKVVVAPVGTTIYPVSGEPITLRKARIRGQESAGMICAEDEIGLGHDHGGIMVLDPSAPVGQALRDFLQLDNDHLLEIGLTPNRADAMSHFGVARDLLAVYNVRENKDYRLQWTPADVHTAGDTAGPIKVKVEDQQRCPRYAGVFISNIKVQPSPAWLQNQLRTIGVRPINNVVDITNFICHDLGQPLHAFDAAAINGNEIVVKTVAEQTAFTTLDQVERKLSAEDLMICNSREPMCIGGVFGGARSGVTEQTQAIFLEAAYFNPVSIRRSAKRHTLSTDASFRFERGIDPNITLQALHKAAQMIAELAGGQVQGNYIDLYPRPIGDNEVGFNLDRCNRLIGDEISPAKAERIFEQLQITIIDKKEKQYQLKVPAYRNDVLRECDVAEEILRLISFNSIPTPEKVSLSFATQRQPEPEFLYDLVAASLSSQGYHECMSNSLTRSQYAEWADNSEVNAASSVMILNPLSSELDAMRQTLFFNSLENVLFNQNRRNEDLKLFEFGKTYRRKESGYHEEYHLNILLAGKRFRESWRNKEESVSIFDLKETLHTLFSRLGLKRHSATLTDSPWFDQAQEIRLDGTLLATCGTVKPEWLKRFDIRQEVIMADIHWDALLTVIGREKTRYRPIPKFPAVRRDLSLTLDEKITFAQIEQLARKQEKKLLKDINLFDVYKGKNLEKGKKSYAVSFILQDEEKTLTDSIVEEVMDKIMRSLSSELGASLRA